MLSRTLDCGRRHQQVLHAAVELVRPLDQLEVGANSQEGDSRLVWTQGVPSRPVLGELQLTLEVLGAMMTMMTVASQPETLSNNITDIMRKFFHKLYNVQAPAF